MSTSLFSRFIRHLLNLNKLGAQRRHKSEFEENDKYIKQRFPDVGYVRKFSYEEGPSAFFNSRLAEMSRDLLPLAARRVGIGEDGLRRRFKKANVNMLAEVNGRTYTSDRWNTFEIDLSAGLLMLTYHFIMILVTRMSFMNDEGFITEQPRVSFREAVSFMKRLMKAFWDQTLFQIKGLHIRRLSDKQIQAAGMLIYFADRFIIAHEFGHVVIKLSTNDVPEVESGRRVIQHLSSELWQTDRIRSVPPDIQSIAIEFRKLSALALTEIEAEWSEEFAADLIGLQLSVDVNKERNLKMLAFSSAELVFMVMHMLEAYYIKTRKQGIRLGTHPPSLLRLDMMRASARKGNAPQVFEIGEAAGNLAEEILLHI